ncbi:hypothetical protein Tco_1076294 [Tanacetum coccineum]
MSQDRASGSRCEEISEGGIPRGSVLGYVRTPDCIDSSPTITRLNHPGPEDPLTPPILQTRMSGWPIVRYKRTWILTTCQDPEEYEDDETVDESVELSPMDGGDDGDDDDGDSSRDDANDEDEDEEEEEEHLALADSAVVVPTDEPDTWVDPAKALSYDDSTYDVGEMSDMQAELLALRGHQRRARQPGPDARIPDHQDASGDADSHI